MKKNNTEKQKIEPLGDRVLIKGITQEDKKTAGGIIIPDSVKGDRSTKRGTVVAVGLGKYENGKRVALSVSKGDTVLYGWGDEVVIDGVEYTLVRDSEIMAIIKN